MTDAQAAADTRTVEQIEIDRLKSELEHFTKSGIIEIAVRNPSVADYMAHWEGRALKAEAAISSYEAETDETISPYEWMAQEFDRLAVLRKMWTAHEVAAMLRRYDIHRPASPPEQESRPSRTDSR